jgi:hypothetical protein
VAGVVLVGMAIAGRAPTGLALRRARTHSDLCRRQTPPAATITAVAACLDAERCLRCRYLKRLLESLPPRPALYHYV